MYECICICICCWPKFPLTVWQWQPILCCGCLDFWRNIWEFKQNKFCESQSHHMRRQLASFKCEAYLQFNCRLIRGGNWRRRFRHKRRQLRSFLTSSCWGSRSTTAGWTESGRDRGAGWGEVERHGRDLTWDFLLCVKASFRKFWHVAAIYCGSVWPTNTV